MTVERGPLGPLKVNGKVDVEVELRRRQVRAARRHPLRSTPGGYGIHLPGSRPSRSAESSRQVRTHLGAAATHGSVAAAEGAEAARVVGPAFRKRAAASGACARATISGAPFSWTAELREGGFVDGQQTSRASRQPAWYAACNATAGAPARRRSAPPRAAPKPQARSFDEARRVHPRRHRVRSGQSSLPHGFARRRHDLPDRADGSVVAVRHRSRARILGRHRGRRAARPTARLQLRSQPRLQSATPARRSSASTA